MTGKTIQQLQVGDKAELRKTFVDLTFTDKKEQSLAIIIVARLFRSQSRKESVVL